MIDITRGGLNLEIPIKDNLSEQTLRLLYKVFEDSQDWDEDRKLLFVKDLEKTYFSVEKQFAEVMARAEVEEQKD